MAKGIVGESGFKGNYLIRKLSSAVLPDRYVIAGQQPKCTRYSNLTDTRQSDLDARIYIFAKKIGYV